MTRGVGVLVAAVLAVAAACGSDDTAPTSGRTVTTNETVPRAPSHATPDGSQSIRPLPGTPTTLPRVEGTKVFGEQSEPCPPTVLSNDADDRQRLQSGAACFLAEVDAGRSVTWDVLVTTIEGDPVPTRYDFDGEAVTITTDYTFDEWSNGGVSEQRCAGVVPTDWRPAGRECTSANGDGFSADSLP